MKTKKKCGWPVGSFSCNADAPVASCDAGKSFATRLDLCAEHAAEAHELGHNVDGYEPDAAVAP